MKISDERVREAVIAYKAVKWGDDSRQVFEDEMHAMRAALEAAVGATYKVTAYRCEACDHWNNLARRKKTNPTEPPGGGE